MPVKHTRSDWIEKLDRRTVLAKTLHSRLEALEADLGGSDAMSYQERSLTRRAVWLEALIESRELALAKGEPIDESAHVQSINTLLGLWRALGLQRRTRTIDLTTYLQQRGAA